jgi:sugar/nucleoside kinase (ribokinase family)
MSRPFDVVGLGNALVDSLVTTSDHVIADIGHERGLMHLVEHAPWMAAYDRFSSEELTLQTGGSCANTIAALGLLGGNARFRGNVGRDAMGERYAAQMAEACGGHAISFAEDQPTGKCLALVSDKDAERTMLTHLGAAPSMTDLGALTTLLPQTSVLHITGYVFLGGPIKAVALQALEAAKTAGTQISIDIADPYVVATLKDEMWTLLQRYADIVFMNEEEAKALTGDDAHRALERVGSLVSTAVVKLGRKGSLVCRDGETTRIGIETVHAIDSTGAGDSYAAGYLYGHTRGWSPAKAGALGARVAGLTVAQMGAVVRDRAVLKAARDAVAQA